MHFLQMYIFIDIFGIFEFFECSLSLVFSP